MIKASRTLCRYAMYLEEDEDGGLSRLRGISGHEAMMHDKGLFGDRLSWLKLW